MLQGTWKYVACGLHNVTFVIRQTDVFSTWLRGLRDQRAKQKITGRLQRLKFGHFGDVEPVGPGVSELRIHDIVNEKKPVSAPVAARLGKLFGNGSLFWIRMQGAYDAWHAEREIDVSQVPTLDVA